MAEQLPSHKPPRVIAQARRDAGLKRTSRLTAWVLAGSVALAGVLSAVAAQAVPGHAKRVQRTSTAHKSAARKSASSGSTSSSSSSTNPSAATDSSTLQAPAQKPAPSSSSAGSGGTTGGSSGGSVSGGS